MRYCLEWDFRGTATPAAGPPASSSVVMASLGDVHDGDPQLGQVGYYWGLKLYLVCDGDGMSIMWCLANPKIGDREVLAVLLRRDHHLISDGQDLLADSGFASKDFAELTTAMGLRSLRPDRKDEGSRHGNLGGVRQ